MSLFRANTSRRREVRRNIPRQRPALRELLTRGRVVWGAVLAIALTVAASAIALDVRMQPRYRPGQLVDRAQVARVAFTSVNVRATDDARRNAAQKTPGVYVPETAFLEATHKALANLPAVAATVSNAAELAPELRESFGLSDEIIESLRPFYQEGEVSDRWRQLVDRFMLDLRHKAIIESNRYQIEKQSLPSSIELRPAAEAPAVTVYEDRLVNVADAKQLRMAIAELTGQFPEPVQQAVITYFLREPRKAVYRHDEGATRRSREAAAEAVQPLLVSYEPNQVIVPAGTMLDEDSFRLLQMERQRYFESLRWDKRLASRYSPAILVAMLSIALVGYIAAVKPRVITNPMRGLALTALILAGLALAWAGQVLSPDFGSSTLMAPALLVAMIVAVAYDQRFALGIAVFQSLLIGVVMNLSMASVLLVLAPSVLAVGMMREVRHRGTLGRVGLVSGAAAALAVWAVGMGERNLTEGLVSVLAWESGVSLMAGIMVGFVVLGVLPFIERLFRVTTAMTLLELCDVNQPLLRRLAQSAPGTYNHSLQVGTLAEAAAEAIGANSLLARVGAYYHDIGKIHKPQYFVENQTGGHNLHEKLSPAMSLLIIVGHVKDGIEMAREYGLPPSLHHFIESHHGTTLVEYFYHAAKRQRSDQQQPEEIEFRYPGPKPQTKEAAILMVCDATESACRTMSEPTAVRIEQLVHQLLMKRLMDGQFDQCDITLAELEQVELAITRTLAACYHGRIAYPGGKTRERTEKPETSERAAI